jgi:DNA replication protein DnaC
MQIFEGRRSRPTIVTSNLTLKGLADIDARLASRLLRHGNKVIACDTIDYALRNQM